MMSAAFSSKRGSFQSRDARRDRGTAAAPDRVGPAPGSHGGHVAIQSVRFQARLCPHTLYGGLAQSQRLRHLPARPMRRTIRGFLLRLACDPGLHLRVRHARLTAFVSRIEPVQSFLFKSLLPSGNRRCTGLQRSHNVAVGSSFRQRQDQPRAKHVPGRQRPRSRPFIQLVSLFVGQSQHELIPSHDYQTDQN
jgi:hypothetical protein